MYGPMQGVSYKDGPDIETALDPDLTQNLFQFVEHIYFEHFSRARRSAKYAGWLSFVIRKVIVHILK